MPITSIIFSKDRPLQLDLCLSSMENHDVNNVFKEKIVIYQCSNSSYEKSYEKLRKEHPYVSFWQQGKSLFNDVDVAVSVTCATPYVSFLTDDNIFYNDVLLSDSWFDSLFEKNDIISHISLRLGENTQHRDDGTGQMLYQPVGQVTEFNGGLGDGWEKMYLYDRSVHYYGGYWNYPISLDGHIFKADTVSEWTGELCYLDKIKNWKQNPNELERALQRFCQECPPLVAIPPKGCVVNSPNNQVSSYFEHGEHKNAYGEKYDISTDQLLELFERGYRIRSNVVDEVDVICPHQEIDIIAGVR